MQYFYDEPQEENEWLDGPFNDDWDADDWEDYMSYYELGDE